MRPRYRDLFKRMRHPDPDEADKAYDDVLFERHEALPDLVECYGSARKDAILRFLVVQLMGFSGATAAVGPLITALDDPDPAVRAEACRALEDLKARDGLPALRSRLDDLSSDVRQAAREAISALETRRSSA